MEITKLQKFLENCLGGYTQSSSFSDDLTMPISGEVLTLMKDKLLTFDEFKGVKKINILPLPIYLVKKGTHTPLTEDKNYLGEDTDTVTTETYKLGDGESNFGEEIDLLSICLSPKMYDPKDLNNNEIGVRRIPLLYDKESFTPKEKIEIVWSKEAAQDSNAFGTLKDEGFKERLMRLFEEALDGKHDIPAKRGIMVRISPRSLKQKEVVNE